MRSKDAPAYNLADRRRYRVKKYGLTMMTSADDQVKAYIKKIMSQLNKWMQKSKISKLVVVITSKETGEHVERWQFDVSPLSLPRNAAERQQSPEPNCYQLTSDTRSTYSAMTAQTKSRARLHRTRRTLLRSQSRHNHQCPRRSQNRRSSKRSNRCSDRLQLQ